MTSPWNGAGAGGPSSGASRSRSRDGPGPARPPHAARTAPGRYPPVQRQPPGQVPAAPGPVGQQERLAVPGRPTDQDQPRARPSSRRAISRGRGTNPGRDAGMCSLAANRTSRSGAITDNSTIADLHALAPPAILRTLLKRPSYNDAIAVHRRDRIAPTIMRTASHRRDSGQNTYRRGRPDRSASMQISSPGASRPAAHRCQRAGRRQRRAGRCQAAEDSCGGQALRDSPIGGERTGRVQLQAEPAWHSQLHTGSGRILAGPQSARTRPMAHRHLTPSQVGPCRPNAQNISSGPPPAAMLPGGQSIQIGGSGSRSWVAVSKRLPVSIPGPVRPGGLCRQDERLTARVRRAAPAR